MNKLSLAIGSIVFASLSVSAFATATAPSAPADVVDVSIGTDLMVDGGFGDMGYTIVNYNNGTDTWDEVVRLLPADGGGYWMTGFHKLDATGDQVAISKLDVDGRLDLTFGTAGTMLADTGVNQIHDIIVVEGRFYAAGLHYLPAGRGDFAIACVEANGMPCIGFGTAGTVEVALNGPTFSSDVARILYSGGALYAVGNTDPGGPSGHSSAIGVAKLDAATGALDATFGDGSGPLPGTVVIDPELIPDSLDFAYAAALASNGHILVGGSAQSGDNSNSAGYLFSIDPDTGSLDSDFGTNGYLLITYDTGVHFDGVSVTAIKVQADGRILLTGNANHDDEFFNTLTDVLLGSFQPDGTPTPGFGTDGSTHVNLGLNTYVTDLVARPNGDLVVSLASNGIIPNPYNSDTLQSIAQFDATGAGPTATVSFEYPSLVTPQGRPVSMLVDSNDRVLVAGFRLWNYNFPIPDSDHTVTRLERDSIFANGFE